MTTYRYDGFLKSDVLDSVAREGRKYPHPIEMCALPDHRQMSALFADKTYTHVGEDCMGIERVEEREGISWCWISRNFADPIDVSGFLMLPTEEARRRVIAKFDALVINPEPFTTVFTVPRVPSELSYQRVHGGTKLLAVAMLVTVIALVALGLFG